MQQLKEFERRARELVPRMHSNVIMLAWEECMWIDTLTDERLAKALYNACTARAMRRYPKTLERLAKN